MRVAIIGSRDWTDYLLFTHLLEEALALHAITVTRVVSGGARGADTFAEIWACTEDVPVDIHLPDYRLGRAAPLVRNGPIVAAADVVIAFPIGASRGTADAMRKARALGRPLHVIRYHT